jgi:hypothetical protein
MKLVNNSQFLHKLACRYALRLRDFIAKSQKILLASRAIGSRPHAEHRRANFQPG